MEMRRLFFVLLCAVGSIPAVASDWVQWPISAGGNGHWYRAVYRPLGITWEAARAESLAGGSDLVSIGSADENNFILPLIADPSFWSIGNNIPNFRYGPWIGGMAPLGRANPASGWSWSDGTPFGYTNWASAEPNNSYGIEDRIHYVTHTLVPDVLWNDLDANGSMVYGQVYGFVEERTQPVAEPASLGALALGVASFVRRRVRGPKAR